MTMEKLHWTKLIASKDGIERTELGKIVPELDRPNLEAIKVTGDEINGHPQIFIYCPGDEPSWSPKCPVDTTGFVEAVDAALKRRGAGD